VNCAQKTWFRYTLAKEPRENRMFFACSLRGLLFDPGDKVSMFLRNVSELPPDYTPSHPRRQHFCCYHFWHLQITTRPAVSNSSTAHMRRQLHKGKGKGTPVTGRGGTQGCETSRLPHFLDNPIRDGGKVVRLTRRPPFTPRKFLVFISVILAYRMY
jgi:hypothetical protein